MDTRWPISTLLKTNLSLQWSDSLFLWNHIASIHRHRYINITSFLFMMLYKAPPLMCIGMVDLGRCLPVWKINYHIDNHYHYHWIITSNISRALDMVGYYWLRISMLWWVLIVLGVYIPRLSCPYYEVQDDDIIAIFVKHCPKICLKFELVPMKI